MILYADTSALMKLLLVEDGSEQIQRTVREADIRSTVAIAYVELRAALAAAMRGNRITAPVYARLLTDLERLWEELSEVPVDRPLVRHAGELAERLRLRGYDAVHLAALLEVGGPDTVTFAYWDQDLRRAATELGYTLVPA